MEITDLSPAWSWNARIGELNSPKVFNIRNHLYTVVMVLTFQERSSSQGAYKCTDYPTLLYEDNHLILYSYIVTTHALTYYMLLINQTHASFLNYFSAHISYGNFK